MWDSDYQWNQWLNNRGATHRIFSFLKTGNKAKSFISEGPVWLSGDVIRAVNPAKAITSYSMVWKRKWERPGLVPTWVIYLLGKIPRQGLSGKVLFYFLLVPFQVLFAFCSLFPPWFSYPFRVTFIPKIPPKPFTGPHISKKPRSF